MGLRVREARADDAGAINDIHGYYALTTWLNQRAEREDPEEPVEEAEDLAGDEARPAGADATAARNLTVGMVLDGIPESIAIGLTLLFVYIRRNEAFTRFRNWILLANVIGLIGYIALPTAPPRYFPTFGFPQVWLPNHGSGLVEFAANPYAAMPSLHAADALIVGISMAGVCRHWWSKTIWLLWPAWVWFAVMATGNHFWLDILAGIVVAAISAVVIYRKPLWRRLRSAPAPV